MQSCCEKTKIQVGGIRCLKHNKRLCDITPDGLVMLCKGSGGHTELITWEEIDKAKNDMRENTTG
jgi:hypothetical protein